MAFFWSNVTPDGVPVGREFDLYDNAFGLFGLAVAFAARRDRVLLAILAEAFAKSIENWGIRWAVSKKHARVLPLRANPHMHFWRRLSPGSQSTP